MPIHGSWDRFEVRYDRELETRLPELANLTSSPGTQLLIRVYVEQLPDESNSQRSPKLSWTARMEALAEQYGTTSFVAPDEKVVTLLLLANVNQFTPNIAADIHAAAEKLGPPDQWQDSYTSYMRKLDLMGFHILLDLQEGDQSSLNQLLAQFNVAFESKRHGRSFPVQIPSLLANRIETIDIEKLKDALPKLLRLELLSDNHRGEALVSTAKLWFHLNGRSAEFDKIIRERESDLSIPQNRRKIVWLTNNQGGQDWLWATALRMRPGIRDAELAERVEFVKQVWGVNTRGENMRAARLGLNGIFRAKVLTEVELLEVGHLLARIDSDDGEIWRQLGYRQMWAEQWSAAARSFRRAVTSSPTLTARSNRQVEHAWALQMAGEEKAADALIANIRTDRLTIESQDRLTAIRRHTRRQGNDQQ